MGVRLAGLPLFFPQRGMNATTDSSISQGELEEFIDEIFQSQAINYVNLTAFVVLLYDYVVTLDCEVRFAWHRNFSSARAVFLLNRYLSLLLFLLSLDPLLPAHSLLGCKALNYSMQTLVAVLYAVWAAFSGLRIWAISDHNRIITPIVALLALVPVATNLYLESQLVDVFSDDAGCVATIPVPLMTWKYLSAVTRACLVQSEAVVISVTWLKTRYRLGRPTKAMSSQTSLMALIFKEGMLFFVVTLTLNIIQIIFTFVESDTLSLVLQFVNVLTPILISRFYFDLDELKHQETTATLPHANWRDTSLRFTMLNTDVNDNSSLASRNDDTMKRPTPGSGFPRPQANVPVIVQLLRAKDAASTR